MLRRCVGLAALVALLGLGVGSAAAQDEMPPAPPGLLLVGDENGLFTMRADGSDKTYLVEESDASCWLRDGAWRPDGAQVIYTVICGGGSAADWRPDPERTDLPARTAAVYLYDLASSANSELVPGDGTHQDYAGDWHPDGASIVFYSDRGGSDIFNLFTYDLASGEIAALTDFDSNVSRVSYDPSGRYLLYNRRIVQPDGEGLRFEVRVYDTQTGTEIPVAQGMTPNWSPDGQWIAFATEGAASDIFVMPAACIYNGGGCDAAVTARNMTRTPQAAEREPVFSPDQSELVYVLDTSPETTTFVWDVVRQDLRTGRHQNLTNTSTAEERHRGWEPVAEVERVDVADMLAVVVEVNTAGGPANLRAGPSTNTARVGQATNGEQLWVQGRSADGAWFQVLLPDGSYAWIFAELVKPVEGDPTQTPVIE